MKKIIIIFVVVIISIFAVFSFLGRNDNYLFEKQIWNLQKEFVELMQDKEIVANQQWNDLIDKYEKLIASKPDNPLTVKLYFPLGELYIAKKDFNKARSIFAKTIDLNQSNKLNQSDAFFAIARSYEIEGKWEQALSFLERISTEFPLTPAGLKTPVYVANYYKKNNDYENTMNAYEKAIKFYTSVANEHKETSIGFLSIGLLSDCYLAQNRWEEGLNTLKDILIVYVPKGFLKPIGINVLIQKINTISIEQLKDKEKAVSIYGSFIEKNPKHPLSKALPGLVKQLKSMKEIKVSQETSLTK